jgi:hypothetical protein
MKTFSNIIIGLCIGATITGWGWHIYYRNKLQRTEVICYSRGIVDGRQGNYPKHLISEAFLDEYFVKNGDSWYQGYRTFEIVITPSEDHYHLWLQKYENCVFIKDLWYTDEYERLMDAL